MSGATVVEGSGGSSIQNLIKSVLANATATGRFGNAGLTFAPTDSYQVSHHCNRPCNSVCTTCRRKTSDLCGPTSECAAAVQLLCCLEQHSQVRCVCVQGKQGVITQSFAYAMSTLPLTAAELAQAKRLITVAPLPLKCFVSV